MGKMISAYTNDALGTLDAVGVAEAIASGQISAKEAAEAAIARAEKVDADLGAIVFKTYDMARDRANAAPTGDLGGVPTFIKDNEMVKGVPTQFGTKAFRSKPAKKNSRFVEQFLSTGLNSLGKSTMPEFGLICSTENPNWGITRNPWNTDYTTGGSSSGSAAMVASGVVPIALANDGAGSTRIPASCCGLVGLKPTRDRLVNAEGVDSMPINIVFEGVLTRSVRDTAAFYAAAEKYFRNPSLPALGHVQHPNEKKLKIVFFENIAQGKAGHQDADTYNTMLSTAKLLESLGHTVDQVPFPFDIRELSADFLNYYGLFAYALKNFGGLFLDSKPDKKQLENFTNGLARQFRRNIFGISRSLKRLKTHCADAESLFGKYDLILTPVLAHSVPPIGHFSIDLSYEEVADRAVSFASFTGIQNVTGSPAISLPMGTCRNGLPIGAQFCAPYGQDKLLLELAYELEAAKPWSVIYNS
jgi:amidase